jgi:hypothetical protein
MKYTLLFMGMLMVLNGCVHEEIADSPKPPPELITIARETGFTLTPVNQSEKNFLHTVIPGNEERVLRSVTILRENDRIAAVFWYHDENVAAHMQTLTMRLFDHFSSGMHTLVDEVIQKEGYAPIDILAFTDPVLSEERFVFAVIHHQLYEFHVNEENEGWVQGLLLEIAKI